MIEEYFDEAEMAVLADGTEVGAAFSGLARSHDIYWRHINSQTC